MTESDLCEDMVPSLPAPACPLLGFTVMLLGGWVGGPLAPPPWWPGLASLLITV